MLICVETLRVPRGNACRMETAIEKRKEGKEEEENTEEQAEERKMMEGSGERRRVMSAREVERTRR